MCRKCGRKFVESLAGPRRQRSRVAEVSGGDVLRCVVRGARCGLAKHLAPRTTDHAPAFKLPHLSAKEGVDGGQHVGAIHVRLLVTSHLSQLFGREPAEALCGLFYGDLDPRGDGDFTLRWRSSICCHATRDSAGRCGRCRARAGRRAAHERGQSTDADSACSESRQAAKPAVAGSSDGDFLCVSIRRRAVRREGRAGWPSRSEELAKPAVTSTETRQCDSW
jgi:hypothetical protein